MESVLRDILLEMGVRGAEKITAFHIACMADFLSEYDRHRQELGKWPRNGKASAVKSVRPRSDWAHARFYAYVGKSLEYVHTEALKMNEKITR